MPLVKERSDGRFSFNNEPLQLLLRPLEDKSGGKLLFVAL